MFNFAKLRIRHHWAPDRTAIFQNRPNTSLKGFEAALKRQISIVQEAVQEMVRSLLCFLDLVVHSCVPAMFARCCECKAKILVLLDDWDYFTTQHPRVALCCITLLL